MTDEGLRIVYTDDPGSAVLEVLEAGLVDHSRGRIEPRRHRPLTVLLYDGEGRVCGGAHGATVWRWLHIKHLWVAEELRGQGWGRRLMAAAEQQAVQRGCHHAHLDTFSFQSPLFYEALGYEVFGALEDFPPGACRLFMRKLRLSGETS